MIFATPPEPLTTRQKRIVLIAAIVCAASRFLAMARSIWDWDEALFSLGMGEYDVTQHHPHPPGFPAYIAVARVLKLVVGSDFRALQTINMVAAVLVFPAIFFFARELRFRFSTSLLAGVLFAFFPNVWFFGGTAFSDVPSIVLATFAATLLFRGVRDRNAYWLGTFLLAVAIGIRPQNLLIGLAPGILATLKRKPHEIAVALLIGIAITGAAFGGAIYATGSYEKYMSAVRHHGDYIARVDSFRAPGRPPLWRLLDRFFVKQYASPVLSVITSLFVLVSLIRGLWKRDWSVLWNVATFVLVAISAWLMLDRFSVSRFSIGYLPMFAVLAADGIARVMRRERYALAFGGALTAAFVLYTLPALTAVRKEISPTVSAVQTTIRNIQPQRDRLFVAYSMVPFLEYFAPGLKFTRVMDDLALPLGQTNDTWLLAEITDSAPEGFYFHRDRGRLWNIARRHYFDVVLKKVTRGARFASGWYDAERAGMDEWRWMRRRSVTMLPPAKGDTVLRLQLNVPAEALPNQPRLTVRLNGRIVEELDVKATEVKKEYRVSPAPAGQENRLDLAIEDTVRAVRRDYGDARELGASLRYLSWGPA